MAWPAIATASSISDRNIQIVKATWCAAIATVPTDGGDVGHDEQRRPQRHGAHDQRDAGCGRRPGCRGRSGCSGAPSRRAPRTTTTTNAAAMPTCARRCPRAEPAMPKSSAVDQDQVEHDVRQRADGGHDQRGAGVLQAAQHAGGGEHDQHRGHAEQGDPQVGQRVRRRVCRRAEGCDQRARRRRPATAASSDADGQRPARGRRSPGRSPPAGRRRRAAGRRPPWCRRRGRRRPRRTWPAARRRRRARPAAGCPGGRRWPSRRAGTAARRPARRRRGRPAGGSRGPRPGDRSRRAVAGFPRLSGCRPHRSPS